MTGLRRDVHVTHARRQLGWLTIEMRRIYFSAITIYKARRFGQPKYSAELFETRRRIDLGRVDAIRELKLCSSSSEAGKKSFKNVQNFGMNCPTEYVTSTPWEDVSLAFLNTFFKMTLYNYLNNHFSYCHWIRFILFLTFPTFNIFYF